MTLNGNPAEAYSYNANGNRISATCVLIGTSNQTATYNNGDQLLSNGNQAYQYDTNGRLQSKTRTANDGAVVTTTYQYSSDGRLQNVVTPEKTIEYRHNALGNRVAKLINGTVVEKYLWQNKTTLLAIYDANNNLKQRFEYTLGHAPTAFTQNGSKYYILTDQLGTPRLVTDSSGNVVKQISYDSYGNVIEDSAPEFTLPFGFAGGLYDADTGLIRFGYRDYDPEAGRWTARDPIGFEGGDSNLYGYVLGDPVNFVDPSGQAAWAVLGAAVGGVFGGVTAFYNTVSGYTNSGQAINWSNVAAQVAIGTATGALSGAMLPGSPWGNTVDAVGAVMSAAVGTYLDGGSYVDAAKAASISFLANTFGGKVGTNIQRRIGQGIDAPAKILHEVASSLSAAQKVLLAQILSSALNITVEEAERILNEVLNGC